MRGMPFLRLREGAKRERKAVCLHNYEVPHFARLEVRDKLDFDSRK